MTPADKPPEKVVIAAFHRVRMRIPFRDVDSWGLVWHGHYFSYIDHARIDLLRHFDVPFVDFPKLGFVMPVVHVHMDLRAPGRADDAIAVDVAIVRTRGAMADTHFRIVLDDGKEDRILARGYTRQVFMRADDGALLYHVPAAVEPGFDAMNDHALGLAP